MTGVRADDLAEHAFVRGLPAGDITRLATVASYLSVPAGHRLFEEGGTATRFWLVRTGHLALDLHAAGGERLIVETIGGGGLIGLSWTSSPRQWQYGAEAVAPTDAFELDAAAVTSWCDEDPLFGYRLIRRLLAVAAGRLHASRIRLLDLYGAPGRAAP